MQNSPFESMQLPNGSSLIQKRLNKKKKQKRVTFDDSRVDLHHDKYSQRERVRLYYTSKDLASFRSESRQTFVHWCLKSNERQAFVCGCLHDHDSNQQVGCLRGLEEYHRRHVHEDEGRPKRIPQCVVKFQKDLQALNGYIDPVKLAVFYQELNKNEILQARYRALRDEKIAHMVYLNEFSSDGSTIVSEEIANDFVRKELLRRDHPATKPFSKFLAHLSPKRSPRFSFKNFDSSTSKSHNAVMHSSGNYPLSSFHCSDTGTLSQTVDVPSCLKRLPLAAPCLD